MSRTRGRWGGRLGALVGCLGLVVIGTWVAVHAALAFMDGYPEVPAAVALLMLLGGWGGPKVAGRLGRPDAPGTDFLALTPAQFEEAVARLCERDGCRDVRTVGGTGDLAADILAVTPTGRRMLVQCKRYAPGRRVGSPEVQQVGGTYQVVHGADLAVVVTTAAFTEAALNYANAAGIRLVDGGELAAWAAEQVLPPWS